MRYDYKCPSCKNVIEVWHSIKEKPEVLCESCGALRARVITGGSGTIFKGNDWPTKEYRREKQHATHRKRVSASQEAKKNLVPNVEGEVCKSWDEAAVVASEKGRDPLSHIQKATEAGEYD